MDVERRPRKALKVYTVEEDLRLFKIVKAWKSSKNDEKPSCKEFDAQIRKIDEPNAVNNISRAMYLDHMWPTLSTWSQTETSLLIDRVQKLNRGDTLRWKRVAGRVLTCIHSPEQCRMKYYSLLCSVKTNSR